MGSEQVNRGSRRADAGAGVGAGVIDQRLIEGAQAQAQTSIPDFGTGLGRFQMGQQLQLQRRGQTRMYGDAVQGEGEGVGDMELDAFGE